MLRHFDAVGAMMSWLVPEASINFMELGGADTFVINYFSDQPDEIGDFEPEKSDKIELRFPEIREIKIDKGNFSTNRKDVVKI